MEEQVIIETTATVEGTEVIDEATTALTTCSTDETDEGVNGKVIAAVIGGVVAVGTGLAIGGKKLYNAHKAKKAEKALMNEIFEKFKNGELVVKAEEAEAKTEEPEPEAEVEVEPEAPKKETNKKK